MELSGALSNPFSTDKDLLVRVRDSRKHLLEKAVIEPREPRAIPGGRDPVLETVTRVLECAVKPLRACEVHNAAEDLLQRPLKWSSVKAALAANAVGRQPRFRRTSYGRYRLS